jgi:hypothetical protein
MVFAVGSAPRLYYEDLRPAEIELREPLEMAVEYDGTIEDIVCHVVVC